MILNNDRISIQLSNTGVIEKLSFQKHTIPFRQDKYRGLHFFVVRHGTEFPILLKPDESPGRFAGELDGVKFSLEYLLEDGNLTAILQIRKDPDIFCEYERVFVRLGIDSYMEHFPEWNARYFPTLLRCEKTHFFGYMMSPHKDCIAFASPDPIASWSLDYNRAIYGDENHVGHRIYTACIDLINIEKQPQRHPVIVSLKEKQQVKLTFTYLSDLKEFNDFIEKVTGAPVISLDRYTIERGQSVKISSKGTFKVIDPGGKEITEGTSYEKAGIYKVIGESNGKISEAMFYVRESWSWYLICGAKAAMKAKQKASTHTESWYGFFSAFLALKHGLIDSVSAKQIKKEFIKVFSLMYKGSPPVPVKETMPGRIQNTACMISLLTDVFEATGEEEYLLKASELGEFLMRCQSEDGAYRDGMGVHYTCVVYPAKSMLELYLCEKQHGWTKVAERHYESARRAIDNLLQLGDNIQTEGQQTFEDGMISCESLQLGMFGLLSGQKDSYGEMARKLLDKHMCLEQLYIPDCRMRGATLRFWESMYDVLINRNMMNSPHGWTSWKTYATYYLYLLTGEYHYLTETMDTLGSCVQCIDLKTRSLRWAFITDPCIKVQQFDNGGDTPYGELHQKVIGEQYIDMISTWWQPEKEQVLYGFAQPDLGRIDGRYKGGCCDNDVHEHFKCLEEVALTNAFVHELKENDYQAFNCRIVGKTIYVSEMVVKTVYIHCNKETEFDVKKGTEEKRVYCNPGFQTVIFT